MRMDSVHSVQPRLRVWRLEHDLRCCNPDRELRRKLRRFLHQPAGHYPDHLLPAEPGLHVQRLGRLEPKLRERRPHPDRVMRGELRRLLYQPTEHQRHPRHMLPAQPGLHVQRLGRLERELW